MITPTTLLEIVKHHLNGGAFRYSSYDHRAAEAEFKQTEQYEREYYSPELKGIPISKHYIPKDIRAKHQIWRRGKLRKVEFLNDGRISRVYIGSKFALPVYERDCGDIVQLVKD